MTTDLNSLVELTEKTLRIIKHRLSVSTFKPHQFTILQLHALVYLFDNQNVKTGDLAEYLGISPSSSTQLVERLEQLKFVKRTHDVSDRRTINITITAVGKNEIRKQQKKRNAILKGIFSELNNQEIQMLIDIQLRLLSKLQNNQS